MTTQTNKATHRGTCQVCGRVQAVDPIKSLLAKHGYTVDWGYFHGVCRGADIKPLEVERRMTDSIIKELREIVAPKADKLAADLRSGAVQPKYYIEKIENKKRVQVEVTRDQIDDYLAGQFVARAVYGAESEARNARSHASAMEKLIAARFGQPLYPVEAEAKKELKPGARVRIGGKTGWTGEVIEIKDKVCSGCGPYMNGRTMPHAFLRSPKGNIIAIPARTIRQSAILD